MKKGFTLAEVLVTLGIIGVVSALTIPSLVQANQKKVFATQIRKTYSEISQAVANLMTDTQATTLYESKAFRDQTTVSGDFIYKYLKASNICHNCSSYCNDYFANNYYTIEGSHGMNIGEYCHSDSACGILRDGASFCIKSSTHHGDTIAYVHVDTNGKAKPNVIGRDMFTMYIDGKGDVRNSCVSLHSYYADCMFGYLMNNNWEMTY